MVWGFIPSYFSGTPIAESNMASSRFDASTPSHRGRITGGPALERSVTESFAEAKHQQRLPGSTAQVSGASSRSAPRVERGCCTPLKAPGLAVELAAEV